LNVKNQFISIIAHDIKNSLTSINLLSDIIINYNDKLKEEEKLLKISNLKSTSTLLAELLSEMLMWSKSQSGDLEIEIRENNLTSLLSNLIILYGLKDKNENFDINFKLDEQILLNYDYNILNTIIRNLLSNAVKFSGENVKVGLYVYKHEDYTDITISDNGVGMTIEQVDILLDITKSKKLITNSKQKGTGFGINLCLELTKKIGGEFLVESEPNKGTKITVRIPT